MVFDGRLCLYICEKVKNVVMEFLVLNTILIFKRMQFSMEKDKRNF